MRKNLGHQLAPATKDDIIRLLVLVFVNIYFLLFTFIFLNYDCLEVCIKVSLASVSLNKSAFDTNRVFVQLMQHAKEINNNKLFSSVILPEKCDNEWQK